MEWVLIGVLGAAALTLAAALYTTERRRQAAVARNRILRGRLAELAQRQASRVEPSTIKAVGEAAYNALLLIDAGRIVTHINPAALSLFGEGAAEPGLSVMATTRQHELDDLVGESLRTEEILERQVEIQGRPYRARAAAITRKLENGGSSAPVAALALEDVSELHRLGRARRDMVANVSHELRTPISNIRLLVDTLLRGADAKRKQRGRLLAKIAAETDALQQIAQELLDLAQIESGKAEMRFVPVRLRKISERAIARLSEQAERKSQTVEDHIPAELQALADGDQVERVLVNVLHNAIKFTPDGGHITVDAAAKDDWITLVVTDSGEGIAPEDRDRIFERFYRTDRARGRSGTGLGLAIAKHIIAAHGGRIWAEGGPNGIGTRLCFTLPTVEEHMAVEAEAGK